VALLLQPVYWVVKVLLLPLLLPGLLVQLLLAVLSAASTVVKPPVPS